MVNAKIASQIKLSPYVFLATRNDGSDTVLEYQIKSKGFENKRSFENKRDFRLWLKKQEAARKLAAHFNLPEVCEHKSDIFWLACKICELKYGTDYLSKHKHKAAIDGRTYITWILRTFFYFRFREIAEYFSKYHTSIISLYQKFNNFADVPKYPEYKLANEIRDVLVNQQQCLR